MLFVELIETLNMPASKKISIIIVNYQSEQPLLGCLASIYKNLKKQEAIEIIVVNNDESKKLVRLREQFPAIKIIENEKNLGYGGASNLGAKSAEGEVLFFLNPDTEVLSANIEEMLVELKKNKELAILGTHLVEVDGKDQWWNAGVEITLGDIILNNLRIIRSKKIWQSPKKREVDWVSGAALLIKKEVFEKIGGFDQNLFLYFEDIDLCRRAKKLGKKVLYFPEFSVKHLGGKSFSNKKEQKQEYYQSQDYYFQKHFGKLQVVVLKALRRALNWK